jgi:hypothetical protein
MIADQINPDRASPLHCAALSGITSCADLLISHDTDRSLRDIQGRVAADIAASRWGSKESFKRLGQVLHVSASGASGSKRTASQQGQQSDRLVPKPRSPFEVFLVLPAAEKIKRARRWLPLASDDLKASLASYPPDGVEVAIVRLEEARKVDAALNIHKARNARFETQGKKEIYKNRYISH